MENAILIPIIIILLFIGILPMFILMLFTAIDLCETSKRHKQIQQERDEMWKRYTKRYFHD